MTIHTSRRLFVAAAVLAAVGVFALGFFVTLGGRSVVAGPDSAPAASAPNPGHGWNEIGDLPGTIWHSNNDGPASGLDADTVDGKQPGPGGGLSAGTLSRPGFTTNTVDSTGDVGQFTSVAVGVDGLPVIGYYDATNHDLKVAHCGNADCSSVTSTAVVDSTGDVGQYSSVAVGADGLPVISYYDATNDDLKVADCGDADCSTVATAIVDSTGDVGQHTSVAVGADGLPVISYHDATNGDLKVAHCGNVACTSATITTVDGDDEAGGYTSVTVGADGLPIISYHQGANRVRVAHCDNAACTSATTRTVGSKVLGSYTSVAVGADGLPVVSYYFSDDKGPTSFLAVVHCDAVACGSSTSAAFDLNTFFGDGYTSVTVGADGLPVVSYYSPGNGDLKVAHCNNVGCTSAAATTVDSTGDTGGYASVTVGMDGLPLISYYDATNGDLKVAHCSNRFCVPYHQPR